LSAINNYNAIRTKNYQQQQKQQEQTNKQWTEQSEERGGRGRTTIANDA